MDKIWKGVQNCSDFRSMYNQKYMFTLRLFAFLFNLSPRSLRSFAVYQTVFYARSLSLSTFNNRFQCSQTPLDLMFRFW